MHYLIIVLFIGLFITTRIGAMNYKRCGTLPCADEYDPICAVKIIGNGFKTFSSPCELDYVNCLRGDVYKKRHDGECKSLYSGWIWSSK